MKNIAIERKRLGISQLQLAERMGVSRQTIHRWESGKSKPPASAVFMMSSIFGCSSDHLLGVA